jgi:hypothetical protein
MINEEENEEAYIAESFKSTGMAAPPKSLPIINH